MCGILVLPRFLSCFSSHSFSTFSVRGGPMRSPACVKPVRRAFVLASGMSLVFLTGCPNLTQVQQLATTADSGKTAAATIAGDFTASCDRQNMLINLPPGPPPVPPPNKACTDGADFTQVGKNLTAEQSILFAYFDSLGKLSSADATGFEKAAPALNTSFKNAGLTTVQQGMAGAAGSLAADITKLATAGYRSSAIEKILNSSDAAVQTLTTGLANEIVPPGGGHS